MNTEDLLSRITINPNVMVGKPTIRGMRITVEQILRALAGGVTVNELLQDYPDLEQEDLQAVFAYVANLLDQTQNCNSAILHISSGYPQILLLRQTLDLGTLM